MQTVRVSLEGGRGYDILIENGLLSSCGSLIKDVTLAERAAVISDSNLAPLYMGEILGSLKSAGISAVSYVFPAGEQSKNTENVVKMVEFLAESELTRADIVVALGGGVTGDMAGFAAAIYLRGIKFVQIPTTLLSQVDSSVGGKTGVDLPQGKNLCGAFHQPSLVIIDPNTLKTLPGEYLTDGMGEVIKYGCIKSESLFEKLEGQNAYNILPEIIYECVDIKRGVVERDETETGERRLLNFGHTCGHSIEKLSNYSGISHGVAVGIGMLLVVRAAEQQGITEKGTAARLQNLLLKYNLKTTCEYSLQDIAKNMKNDKKRRGNSVSFVLIDSIGTSFIKEIALEDVVPFLEGSLF